jgi:4-hydroxy-tetrahydrodipicolinate reductase
MKIALIGYGKMGKAIERIAQSRGHEIVSRIDVNNQADFSSETFKSADMAIEFTTPATAFENYQKAFAAGVPVVSGSTGWLEKMPEVKRMCDDGKATMFYSSNFSIGVNIFFAVNKYLANIMNRFGQYDVAMKEIHHIHKLDHPSGTAITLAEGIIENIDRKEAWTEAQPKDNEIKIEAERVGEVPGTHIVNYTSAVDSIKIEHEAFSRDGFALGAVMAAEWMQGRKGWHTMDEMLNL